MPLLPHRRPVSWDLSLPQWLKKCSLFWMCWGGNGLNTDAWMTEHLDPASYRKHNVVQKYTLSNVHNESVSSRKCNINLGAGKCSTFSVFQHNARDEKEKRRGDKDRDYLEDGWPACSAPAWLTDWCNGSTRTNAITRISLEICLSAQSKQSDSHDT